MSASSASAQELLAATSEVLRQLADQNHEQAVEPQDQLAAEHAVAAGVAELAGEDRPDPVDELPTRPILAKDLLITVDLVLRALAQKQDL